jgi:hypothetical protein
MMQHSRLRHQFVENIPDKIQPGNLYVSIEYGTAVHSCCCGCGEEVVTPFSPAEWQMSFDGDSVSLHPSVGNWNLACQSHYVISNGRVLIAPKWTKAQIEAGRRRDKDARTHYFDGKTQSAAEIVVTSPAPQAQSAPGVWAQFKRWLRSTFV